MASKKNIQRLLDKKGNPYYIKDGKRAKLVDYLLQYSSRPRGLNDSESQVWVYLKSKSTKKKSSSKVIKVGGITVPKNLEKDLRDFAHNLNMDFDNYLVKYEETIVFYLENGLIETSYTTDKLVEIIQGFQQKILVIDTIKYNNRKELVKRIFDFKRDMINRKGQNIVEVVFFTALMREGYKLKINLYEIEKFLRFNKVFNGKEDIESAIEARGFDMEYGFYKTDSLEIRELKELLKSYEEKNEEQNQVDSKKKKKVKQEKEVDYTRAVEYALPDNMVTLVQAEYIELIISEK